MIELRKEDEMLPEKLNAHLLIGGEVLQIIDLTGKTWSFENHPQMGLMALKQDGNERKSQPSDKSPFWIAVQAWVDQGREFDSDCMCKWKMPGPEYRGLRHLGGNNYEPIFWDD